MFIIKKEKNEVYSLPVKEFKLNKLGNLNSELAQKILQCVAEKPMYPADIAKRLKVHEQKVYYHIRNLEKSGVIKVIKKDQVRRKIPLGLSV